ncbi:MAG: hypothetical protein ACRDJ1_12395 [Actinomycetota bacterium]
MIAASGVLVIVAFVTLIVGVFRTGLGLIWTSIAASVLAAIFLALGVVQGNKRRVATAGGPSTPMPAWSDQPATASTAVMERERIPARDEYEEEEPPTLVAVPEPEPEPEPSRFAPPAPAPAPAKKPAAARSTTRSTAKKPAAKTSTTASAGSVVVIPDRDKFHRDSCRYAKNPAAMSMTKVAAKRQGYKPCATCKP